MLRIVLLDRYIVNGSNEPFTVAKTEKTANNGEALYSYVCYNHYPDKNALPPLFSVADDSIDYFDRNISGEEFCNRISGKISGSWSSLDDAKSSEYYQIFRFLGCFDPASRSDAYYADMVIESEKPDYLFPWDTIPVGMKSVHVQTNENYKGYWALLKVSCKRFKNLDFEYVGFDGLYIKGAGLTALNGEFDSHESAVEIVLPPSVKTIGEYTFAGCRELKQLFLSGDCKIDFSAFRGNGDFGETTHIFLY